MTNKVSLDKSKIKFVLLEGVHQSALDTLHAAGYTNIDFYKKALDGNELKDAIKDVIELSGSKGLIYLRDKEVIEGPYGSNLIDLIPSHIKPQLLDKRKIIEKLKKV